MKKRIFLVYMSLYILSLLGCRSPKSNDFLIINETGTKIDSAKISASGTDYKFNTIITNLLNSDSVVTKLNMENVKKIDGNYYIIVYFKNKVMKKAFGYYSNGVPTNSIYRLTVKNDTIHISEKMK